MVHALEIIHGMLTPGGTLLDLRPTGIPAGFRGYKAGQVEPLGYIDEVDGFIEYRRAAWAMEQAVDRAWFRRRSSVLHDFVMHFDSLAELEADPDLGWSDTILTDDVRARTAAFGPERMTLTELMHIGVMDRI